MTLEQFKKKYGTETTSLCLRLAASKLPSENAFLADVLRELAQDIESLLSDR